MTVEVALLPSRRRRRRRQSPRLLALVRDALIDRCCSRGQIPAVRLHSRHSRLPRFPRSENISSCTALSMDQLMTSKEISTHYVLTGATQRGALVIIRSPDFTAASIAYAPAYGSLPQIANNVGNCT